MFNMYIFLQQCDLSNLTKPIFFTMCPFSNNIVYVYAMSEDFTIAVY